MCGGVSPATPVEVVSQHSGLGDIEPAFASDSTAAPGSALHKELKLEPDSLTEAEACEDTWKRRRPDRLVTLEDDAENGRRHRKNSVCESGIGVDEMACQVTPKAPTVQTSYSHIERWTDAEETLILFDWDDTLCPTTFIWNHPMLQWNKVAPCFANQAASSAPTVAASSDSGRGGEAEDAIGSIELLGELLEQHTSTTAALLRLASSLGQVVIVTLALEGWVDTSIRNFMPSMQGLIEELGIEVVYARKSIPPRVIRQGQEEGQDIGKILKTRAMSKVIKKFYGQTKDDEQQPKRERSWKNVLSIGDSAGERLAVQDIIFRRKQFDNNGACKECRCKVLKILSEPTLEKLTAELQVILGWIRTLVMHDGDVDLDFEELDDEMPSPTRNFAESCRTWK